MKWIKYNILQNTINTGTESSPVYEDILLEKKVGYSEVNLAIAEAEAYNGEYTIEEDDVVLEKIPIAIENGGTGAKTVKEILENLGLSLAAKIQSGSYVGTGTYGSDNKNTLSFDFEPKIVIIQPQKGVSAYRDGLLFIRGITSFASFGSASTTGASGTAVKYDITINWLSSGVEWYDSSLAAVQHNAAKTYYYIAIG